VNDEWRPLAACLGHEPDDFFPRRGDHKGIAAARAVCATCPVVEPCLEAAIHEEAGHDVNHWISGVRGGTSAKQRRVMYQTLRVCPVCDVIFTRTIANQKFCGPECKLTADRKRKLLDNQRRAS
jgi:WhiB family redox-sensing transcriptional regulator